MSRIVTSKTIGTPKTADKPSERRTAERFPFSAVSEIVDTVSHTRISARVSDISLTGCYFDVINIFAPGTKVHVSISHGNLEFKAIGAVVYSLPGMGMGVTFTAVEPDMTSVLQRWIAQLGGDVPAVSQTPEVKNTVQSGPRIERHVLGRLIGLMMQKNMLTAYEGTELLKELLLEPKE